MSAQSGAGRLSFEVDVTSNVETVAYLHPRQRSARYVNRRFRVSTGLDERIHQVGPRFCGLLAHSSPQKPGWQAWRSVRCSHCCKQLDEAFIHDGVDLTAVQVRTRAASLASGAQNSHSEHFPTHETAQTGVTHGTLCVPSLSDALAALEL